MNNEIEILIEDWESQVRALAHLDRALEGQDTDKSKRIKCKLGTTRYMLEQLRRAAGA